MIILRSGITGFLLAPSVKENQFKQICYSLFGSKVLDFIGENKERVFMSV
ncbi:hypothetical protein IM538_13790 [Cytobacillus suaedae]|nr:hypothetical protein IM538_13790 [Cytobacillus suaedae]